jgi:hypothetical protein
MEELEALWQAAKASELTQEIRTGEKQVPHR